MGYEELVKVVSAPVSTACINYSFAPSLIALLKICRQRFPTCKPPNLYTGLGRDPFFPTDYELGLKPSLHVFFIFGH